MHVQPDIAKRIKAIEKLKLEVLSTTNDIFQAMGGESPAASEAVGEMLSALIVSTYRLGITVGVSPKDMDRRAENRLRTLKAIHAEDMPPDIMALDGQFRT